MQNIEKVKKFIPSLAVINSVNPRLSGVFEMPMFHTGLLDEVLIFFIITRDNKVFQCSRLANAVI